MNKTIWQRVYDTPILGFAVSLFGRGLFLALIAAELVIILALLLRLLKIPSAFDRWLTIDTSYLAAYLAVVWLVSLMYKSMKGTA